MRYIKYKTLHHHNNENEFHELTFSCFRKLPLLGKERTCGWLAEAITAACKKHDFSLIAYVFMPDHAHVLVRANSDVGDVASCLKSIKLSVSKRAKNWLELNDPEWLAKLTIVYSTGMERFHFWQPGGGYDRNVANERILLSMIEYIHGNPVRKGLAAMATDWKWSSALDYEGERQGPLAINKDLI